MCPEDDAGKTFLLLVIMDAFVAILLTYLPRALPYYLGKLVGVEMRKGLFFLPKEIVDICYRQVLLIIGSLVAPWLFVVGLITNIVVYFVKYGSVATVYRAPDVPYKATNMKKLFLTVLLASNLVAIVPVAQFLTARNNPNCGPLRTYECAMQYHFKNGNPYDPTDTQCVSEDQKALLNLNASNACLDQIVTNRQNFEAFREVLLPVSLAAVDPFAALSAAAEGNSTLINQLAASCDTWCVISVILSAIFSSVAMIFVSLLLCICLCFARAQSRRLNRQLDHANDECAAEHHDKVKLLRYAGVSLD